MTEEETRLWADRNEAKLCASCVSPLEGQTYIMSCTEPPPVIICSACKIKELDEGINRYMDRASIYSLMAHELRKVKDKIEKKEPL